MPEKTTTPMAQAIQQHREASAMTQPEYAAALGLHVNTVRALEQSRKPLHPITRQRLALTMTGRGLLAVLEDAGL